MADGTGPLPLAIEDLRRGDAAPPAQQNPAASTSVPQTAKGVKVKAKKANGNRQAPVASSEPSILATMPDEATLFKAIEKETSVPVGELSDIFHLENGRLEIKVAAKDLGTGSLSGTRTITALLAGAVFGGTSHRKLMFSEIHDVCRAKHFFDPHGNASKFVKGTSGIAAVGAGLTLAVTPVRGWQDEFVKAVDRVLKKPVAKI